MQPHAKQQEKKIKNAQKHHMISVTEADVYQQTLAVQAALIKTRLLSDGATERELTQYSLVCS